LKANFRGLYTFGSPITLFLLRQSALWMGANSTDPFGKVVNPITRTQGSWVNFYDAEDVIAIPTRTIFPEVPGQRFDEVLVQAGDDLLVKSHVGYWEAPAMARRIALEIHRNVGGA